MTPAIETHGLTKRYRRITALSDCSITVPEGRISALVGPNGAGKTTLLRLLVGLASPTSGEAAILGRAPRQDPAFLAEIGFLAQEIPLYRRMSAETHIGIGAHMNPRWDGQSVRDRLRGLDIPLDARCPGASVPRWRSRSPWPNGRASCSSTSRSRRSTRSPGGTFSAP
jgi:ABC-2 type transport system ATP-binding protein